MKFKLFFLISVLQAFPYNSLAQKGNTDELYVSTKSSSKSLYHPKFYEDPSSPSAKRMLKIFEQISNERWEKASEEFEKIKDSSEKEKRKRPQMLNTELEALFPLNILAHSLIELAPMSVKIKNRTFNGTWYFYKQIKSIDDITWKRVDEFLCLNDKISVTAYSILLTMENSLYNETLNAGTEEEFENLINGLRPSSSILTKAKVQQEHIAYNNAVCANDLEKCEHYLRKYLYIKNDEHFKKVKEIRDRLAYEAAPSTEEGMRKFLKTYPNTIYEKSALNRLYEYAYKGLPQTYVAYKKYVEEFPKSPFYQDAYKGMVNLAYKDAIRTGTASALVHFCEEFPESDLYNDAYSYLTAELRKSYINETCPLANVLSYLTNPKVDKMVLLDRNIKNYYIGIFNHVYSSEKYAVRTWLNGKSKAVDFVMEKTYLPTGETYTKKYIFNDKALIAEESHSLQGVTTFMYNIEMGKGLYLASKSNSKSGKSIYTPVFDDDGNLVELIDKNSGKYEKYIYEDFGDASIMVQRSLYNKNSNIPYLTEIYNSKGQMIESKKNGSKSSYEYNSHGDILTIRKYNSNSVIDMTSFRYDYDSNGNWTTYRQYSRTGDLLVRKEREIQYKQDKGGM